MSVIKKGSQYCTVHGHTKKAGSKTDKPKGSIIHCFPTAKQAFAQHTAIIKSQQRRKKCTKCK